MPPPGDPNRGPGTGGRAVPGGVRPSTTYRCGFCTQLLPFDAATRVPMACLRRCQGQCDWHEIGPTNPDVHARAERDGPVGPDGLP